jgi:hypothetical protein
MAQLSLGQAAKQVGKSKSTITRAIQSGKLSAQRQDDNSYKIEPSELFRVWPATGAQPDDDATPKTPQDDETSSMQSRIELLEALLEREKDAAGDLRGTIDDLRKRLDKAEDRVTALIAPEATRGAREGLLGRLRRALIG